MKLSREQRDMALALLIHPLPASVRADLIFDKAFCAKFGMKPKFWLPLNADIAIDVASLHNALRAAVAGHKSAVLLTRGNGRMRAKLSCKKGHATLVLAKHGFGFADADVLSSVKATRLKAVKRVLAAKPLRGAEEVKWLDLAKTRAFDNREHVELMTDLEATPEGLSDRLEKPRNLDSDAMLPDVPEYYARLVAPPDGSIDLEAFIRGPLDAARKELLNRYPRRALRRVAYSALWQPLIPFELLRSCSADDVATLLDADDPFSLLCGFELCRARMPDDVAFVDLGTRFLKKLLVDRKVSDARCNIFSACAMIATVNIRRAAKASTAPLFWVRLAALTQAGVLAHALSGITDTIGFLKWASNNFFAHYLWTCAIDLRDSPRWHPEWIDPEYLYAELVGRVQGAMQTLPEAERPAAWNDAFEVAFTRLKQTGKLLAAYFPGPFDDFRQIGVVSSSIDAFKEIEAKLASASKLSDVPELAALANASQPSDSVGAHVTRILNAPIDESIAAWEELVFLRLAARIGRSRRDEALANLVMNRCMFMVRRPARKDAVTDVFEVMVEACGAYGDSNKHRAQVGEAATKLCFWIHRYEDLRHLLAVFDVLSQRDEKLISALARASSIARTKINRSPT